MRKLFWGFEKRQKPVAEIQMKKIQRKKRLVMGNTGINCCVCVWGDLVSLCT